MSDRDIFGDEIPEELHEEQPEEVEERPEDIAFRSAADQLTEAIASGILPNPEDLLCIRCDEPAVGYVHPRGPEHPLFVEPRCPKHL